MYLKAWNLGWFSSLCQCFVYPFYNDVIIYFLSFTQFFQYIQGISTEVERKQVYYTEELWFVLHFNTPWKRSDDKGTGDCIISFCVSPSHQLPHQRQSQGRVAVIQVLPADANKGELGCLAQFHRIVTVLQLKATKFSLGRGSFAYISLSC